jgi:hypothetical protein
MNVLKIFFKLTCERKQFKGKKCFVTGGARWGVRRERNETEKYFNFKPRHAPHSIIIQDSRKLSRRGKLREKNPFSSADGHGKTKG